MFPPVGRVTECKRDYLELQTRLIRAALASLEEATLGSHENMFKNVVTPKKKRDWWKPPSGILYRLLKETDSLQPKVHITTSAKDRLDETKTAPVEDDIPDPDVDHHSCVSLSILDIAEMSTEYSDTENEFVWDWDTIEAHALSDS